MGRTLGAFGALWGRAGVTRGVAAAAELLRSDRSGACAVGVSLYSSRVWATPTPLFGPTAKPVSPAEADMPEETEDGQRQVDIGVQGSVPGGGGHDVLGRRQGGRRARDLLQEGEQGTPPAGSSPG